METQIRGQRGVRSSKNYIHCWIFSTPKDLQLALFDLVNYYMKDEHKERRTLGGAQYKIKELQE